MSKFNKKQYKSKELKIMPNHEFGTISETNQTKFTINGKTVKIFLDKNEIETETLRQIKAMMDHECIVSARVMPDCHKGNGCCIGFTFPLIDRIVPNYIGGDIGCGILVYKIGNFNHNKKEKQIDKIIREHVPMGNGAAHNDHETRSIHNRSIMTDDDFRWLMNQSQNVANTFSQMYKIKFNQEITQYVPSYSMEWFKLLCDKIGADQQYVEKEMGTLGGGNHYIEMNIDSEFNKYLTIHSGSRNLGTKICDYHQKKTIDHFDSAQYNEQINKLKLSNLSVQQLKIEGARIRKELEELIHKPYLKSIEAYDYYFDMIFAQVFAQLNRRIMCRQIINNLQYGIERYQDLNNNDLIIESIHNTIDFEDMIVRKGAIRAHQDKLCIVSLNMRDGILLCKGKGNEDWNLSGPHGLGRMVDRGKAKTKFRLQDFEKEMKSVYSTSVCESTLDESPMAYKDTDLVIRSFKDSLEIIEQLKPIINVKAL